MTFSQIFQTHYIIFLFQRPYQPQRCAALLPFSPLYPRPTPLKDKSITLQHTSYLLPPHSVPPQVKGKKVKAAT